VSTRARFILVTLVTCLWFSGVNAGNSLLDQSYAIYKIEDEKLTDVLIEFVNADVLSKKNSRYLGEILLSLAPVGREQYFDCERFYSSIGEQRTKLVRQRMQPYLFLCADGRFTEDAALGKFSTVLKRSITQPYEVDATWAWFSATGNTEALNRFITNYLRNPNTCHQCIEWSYSTNYRLNEDVYLYLKRYSMRLKNAEEKTKLLGLAPKAVGQ